MAAPPFPVLFRLARLARLVAAMALVGGAAAFALALAGDSGRALAALKIALLLGGAALLGTLALLIYARRIRRQQES